MPTHRTLPDLVRDVRSALLVSQTGLAELLGSSKRTVQRWEAGRSTPVAQDLSRMAEEVHEREPDLAAEVALAAGTTPEALGLTSPAPSHATALSPKERAVAIDAVVCAAADATDTPTRAVRAALLAALRRARELGLSLEEMEIALGEARTSPASG